MRLISSRACFTVLLALTPLAMLIGLSTGPVRIPLTDFWHIYVGTPMGSMIDSAYSGAASAAQEKLIIETIRLPRVFLAMVVGALLAACGAILQGLFRNPLADPALIGVSAGASLGASTMIVFGTLWSSTGLLLGLPIIAIGAFAGALLSALTVFRLATGSRGTSVATMLLAGIAISALAGAFNSLFKFFADNDMLRRISLWQMGNLDSATWDHVGICMAVALLLAVLTPRESRALNAMLLGESEARHLGIEVEWLKRRLIGYSALGVAVSVSVAGVIAFVGLMIPHLVRLLIGPDHRSLIPASALAGAILMVLADAVARIVVSPAELPVGVVTAMLGAPFFLALLVKQRGRA